MIKSATRTQRNTTSDESTSAQPEVITNDNTDVATPAVDADATPATPAKAEPKPKTPEQLAAAKRREAGELRRSAKAIGVETIGGVGLIERATSLEAEADALAPRKSGKSSEPRPTCAGTKKDGSPCTARAMEGSTFCTDHRPVMSRFTADEITALETVSIAEWVDLLGWGRAKKLAATKQ